MTEENLDVDLRTVLIDVAFRLACIVPISSLTSDEVDMFMKNIGTRYVVVITKLRDTEYCNWHKLWMFLVRFSGKYLHNSMDLTNKLLGVVEFAFRNVNYLQILRGYDCWKELIDNASLDKAYISSNEQMKLLINPLKAKSSKKDVVICKRFVVFCYLLDKLQEKAVLCLREFLEFCFGLVTIPADSSEVSPVKSVPALWLKSARALIDILGHYHDKEDCVTIEHVIHTQKPLVDSTNFPSFCGVILNSVFECCILLKGINDATEREKVIKCLWGTIFYLAAVTDNNDCFEYISQIVESIVEKSNDDAYFQKILMLIPSAFLTESKISIKLMEKLMKPMWKVLFNAENIPSNISDTFKHCITKIFSNTTTVEEKIKIVKDVMREIVTVQITKKNVQTVNKIWLCLAKEITDEFGVEKLEQFDDFNNFFLWPAYFIHNSEESDKKQTKLLWMKLYRKLTQESNNRKIEIFKDLEKIFKNNILLATNILSLVIIMSQFDTKYGAVLKLRKIFHCQPMLGFQLELPTAIWEGEDEVVKVLLGCTSIIDIECKYDNHTAMDFAALKGNEEIVKKLLEKGHDIRSCDLYDNRTALHYAVLKGNQDIVKMLLDKGANVNADTKFRYTALHFASFEGHEEIVRTLIEHGANVDAQVNRQTALYVASLYCHVEVVKTLLRYGANVNMESLEGETALEIACWRGNKEIINALLEYGADPNMEASAEYGDGERRAQPFGPTIALTLASIGDDREIVKALLEHGANVNATKDGETALNIATFHNNMEVVKVLLEYGADVNLKDGCGCTALRIASMKGHEELVKLLLEYGSEDEDALDAASAKGNKEIVKVLLEYGANVNVKSYRGSTALHRASAEDHEEVVQILLEYQANVNAGDIDGATPLHIACQRGHKKIAEILLKFDADINSTDSSGRLPIHFAEDRDTYEVIARHMIK